MIKKFRKKKLLNQFLNKENICQYILIRKTESEDRKLQWELVTYDSRKDIDGVDHIKSEIIGEVSSDGPLNTEYKCLLTHGFQFEPEEFYSVLAPLWCLLLKMPDFIKELFNILWNDIIKNVDEPSMETIDKATIKRRIKEKKKRLKRSQRISYFFLKYLVVKELVKEAEHRAAIEDNGEFNKQIIKTFLPAIKHVEISHVIYGHSHTKQDTVILDEKPLFNAGGWQQVPEPTFVEIHLNGDIKLKTFP